MVAVRPSHRWEGYPEISHSSLARHAYGRRFGASAPCLWSRLRDRAGEEKMSKSKGNVVDPRDILAMFNGNPDPLRYYLVCENDFGQDAVFSMDGLVSRYHADLADKLGNLLARTTAMITRYLEGRVVRPERFEEADEVVRDALLSLAELAPDASGRSIYEQFIDEGLFAQLLQRVMGAVSKMNAYVTEQQPWRLAKDPAKRERLTQVLYTLAEGLRLSAVLLFPFISRSAQAIWQQLGIEEPLSGASFSQEMRVGPTRRAARLRWRNSLPQA